MQVFLLFRKILSLVVVSALLSLRLSSLTAEVFVVPVEDAIFAVAFIAAEDHSTEGKPPKIKPKRVLDIILAPNAELQPQGERLLPPPLPLVAVLTLNDIHSDIFIPPEFVS